MKSIEFQGHSLQAIRKFPLTVRREVGHQLDRLQRGLEPVDWKPMPTIGKGAREIRVNWRGQYRVIVVTNIGVSIVVLHAFQKKTRKTAKVDMDRARSALKRAMNRQEK
jgi:phage-related protein